MGMNTNDVRNMDFNQWIYWAIALPLTVLVIALCLTWAGELTNFWDGFRTLWRRNPKHYQAIPERFEVAGRRAVLDEGQFTRERPRRAHSLYGNREGYV